MSSHFSCIGFPVRQMSEYEALMREAAAKGERLPLPGGGMLARWEVGDGPEIWALVDAQGEVIDATPFYHIGTPLRVAVTAHGEDPDEEAEGWVEGWVEPVEPDEPISGAFPVRIDLVNFPLVRARLRVGDVVPIEFCGIAHEAALYEDTGAYETAGRVQYQPPMRSFLSLSHFAADEPEGEPEATALISGIIDDAHLLTNRETGAPYWRLGVATEKVSAWVLADRETLPAEPQRGNIVAASCWIVGRVILPE
ncbi:MAG: hypothetical protein XU14_C0065G0008 [Armatimonadetes bacterium CSP1-3]|nr:MAG: hypothetical protein XU14_C0065G0008 [Armatimonadetes bacterium CSP1-3]